MKTKRTRRPISVASVDASPPLPPASDFIFSEGEKVLGLHCSQLYEAVILKQEVRNRINHYFARIQKSSKKSFDRWLHEGAILTYNEEGLAKKRELLKARKKEKVAASKRKNEEKITTNQQSPEEKKKKIELKEDSKSLEEEVSNIKKLPTKLTAAAPSPFTPIAQVKYKHFLIKIFALDQHPRQFYFEPLVLLDPSSIVLMKQGFFKSDVLRLTIEMWNEELRCKVLERLRQLDILRDVKIEKDDICIMPFEEVQLVCTSGSLPQSISLTDKPKCYLRSNENLDLFLFCNDSSTANVLAHDFRQSPEFFITELSLKLQCRGLSIEAGTAPAGSTLPERPTFSFKICVTSCQFTNLSESAAKPTVSLASPRLPPVDNGQSDDSVEIIQQLSSSSQSGSSDCKLDDDVTTGQLDVSAVTIKKCPAGARLTWKPPQSTDGEITEYSVSLAVKGSSATQSEESFSYSRVYCGPLLKCTVSNAALASAYIDRTTKPAIIFRIAARNMKGYGPITQVMWAQDSSVAPVAQIKRELIKLEPDET